MSEDDITRRINADFGNDAEEALVVLHDATKAAAHLASARLIRCIVFLSRGDLKNLKKHIEAAVLDPRDVILWAEYEKMADRDDFIQLRDFSNTFENSNLNSAY